MDGILIINKPKGLTSHDVVLKVRRKIHQQKVGHTGTLDPIATGVLVLALGKATKLVTKLTNQDKMYEVILTLGVKTDSGDITGKRIQEKDVENINTTKVQSAFSKFKGTLMQTPPMVSAKKYKGRPLYKYAREGKTVPRKPKKIYIHELRLGDIKLPEISFEVHCSKGTYIRTLCENIGETLGNCACASSIHRTKSGNFTIDQAINLDEFLELDLNQIKEKAEELLTVTKI